MGCGCSGPGVALPRAAGAQGPRWLRGGVDAGRAAGELPHAHGACCAACAIGAPCGSDVSSVGRDAGDADPFAPCKRRGESERAYIARTGTNANEFRLASYCDEAARDEGGGGDAEESDEDRESRGGLDAETWADMDTRERRAWLTQVAERARLSREQTERFVASLVNAGFTALRNGLREQTTIRLEEIRSGERVEIARIRYGATGERAYLDATRDGSNPSNPSNSSNRSTGVEGVAVVAILGKLLGLF